jgi:predicted O-methyltransferase YrrM
MEPIYTEDWFSGNIGVWQQVLGAFKDKPVRGLEIGSFQGRSARWLMENILTHPESRLACVDTFEGSVEHNEHHLRNLRALFDHNLAPFREKLDLLVGNSQQILRTYTTPVDLAYVDGDHHAFAVLEDAIHAFRVLKPGGFLIFDDYQWYGCPRDIDNPYMAIDTFLSFYRDKITVVYKGYQVVVQKTSE